VSQGRSDSDLDDVWSDVSGEVDRGGELTEFDFNPPSKKKAPPVLVPRPSLTSDLEAPVLGVKPPEPQPEPDPIPRSPPPMLERPTLSVGAVLEGSSTSSLLSDVRVEKREAREVDNRTMIGDAESAAIARAVSRSLLTGVVQPVTVPPILEREDVRKVVMGQRAEAPVPPPPPPLDDEETADDPLQLDPPTDPPTDPPSDAPLELAYDPHERTSTPPPPPPRQLASPIRQQNAIALKWIVLVLAAIVIIAAGVRIFAH
jgi:hypothetical protein